MRLNGWQRIGIVASAGMAPRLCARLPCSMDKCWFQAMNTSALCTSLHRACIIALTAMVAGSSMTAQAADTTLTLACQGTTTAGTEDKPEPISMGIIVNFTKKTVHGFGDPIFGEQLITITGITETAVYFGASDSCLRPPRAVSLAP